VGKNILIFSDGTGQAGGYMPDETRSNVYKLFRATRVSPDTAIDPKRQIAFYDGGLGSRAEGRSIKIKAWRRVYNLLSKATGLGITQNIIDCYAELIRVWQPGDRIYLFGFSRGAYTARCVGGVLKACGVPTAVRSAKNPARALPLKRDPKTARRIAAEAVKHVYQYGSSAKGDPHRPAREARARAFRAKYFSGDDQASNTSPYFIGVWDTVETLGAGTFWLTIGAIGYELLCLVAAFCAGFLADGMTLPLYLFLGWGLPIGLYATACLRYGGLVSLARYRLAFYDTRLHYAVRYARHALSIDENRQRFACVPWDDEPQRLAPGAAEPPRFKQMWFAGNHSDIGGSYPETEARLSDISLSWMVEEATSLPHPIHVDISVLKLYPDSAGPQHDERKALLASCPGWVLRWVVPLVGRRNFGWREGHRRIPDDALLHPSVMERFKRPGVLIYGDIAPYRPRALRRHRDLRSFWPPPAPRPGQPPSARRKGGSPP
jgi:uncharacterized protein (DUF2235 family)